MKHRTGAALVLALGILASYAFVAPPGPQPIIRDLAHYSSVLGEERHFRIFLPPKYDAEPARRYPVVYFFHGWSERYNRCSDEVGNYDSGDGRYGGDTLAAFAGTRDLIIVKWDGFNPRRPGENYLRPYNVGPVETDRQFPLYFLELVNYVDRNFRTIADREHRGVSGISMGGFMSFWIASKFPDLVGSASNFMGAPEYHAGPRSAPTEYRHTEMYGNYDGVRTRLIMGTQDFLRWYHRRMNAVWDFARPLYEHEEYVSAHGTPGMARTLDFHMAAFQNPPPRPAQWRHADVYPSFDVWGWNIETDRTHPGLSMLENVSASGFRSSVREWIPAGALMPEVTLRISSAPLYAPSGEYRIADINLDTRALRFSRQRADGDGRLSFKLDGARHEIGIAAAPEPVMTISDARVEGAPWATLGVPFRLVVTVLNKGAGPSSTAAASLTPAVAPDPDVVAAQERVPVPALEPGQQAEIQFDVAAYGASREILAFRARIESGREAFDTPFELPIYRNAPQLTGVHVFDGVEANVWVHGKAQRKETLGAGNGDGIPQPGERIVLGIQDGPAYRLLELFTSDACVENSARVTDIWPDIEGYMAHYNLPRLRSCTAGRAIPFFARWVLPGPPENALKEGVIRLQVR